MTIFFSKTRKDWYLGSAADTDGLSNETLEQWARQYPPRGAGREYFATEEDRLRVAKGNSAREELRLRRSRRRSMGHEFYASSV
jgi:hypothetical protein